MTQAKLLRYLLIFLRRFEKKDIVLLCFSLAVCEGRERVEF